jgi:hypothetical protein
MMFVFVMLGTDYFVFLMYLFSFVLPLLFKITLFLPITKLSFAFFFEVIFTWSIYKLHNLTFVKLAQLSLNVCFY